MIIQIVLAVAAIGAMSLTAFVQTPDQNTASRKATAGLIVMDEKSCTNCALLEVDLSNQEPERATLTGAT